MSQNSVLAAPLSIAAPRLAMDNLENYVRAINRFPILSAEEELRLARRYRTEGDIDSVHQLVGAHLRIVIPTARKYSGYGLPQADLIQEGNIGLIKAVRRFDPDRGVRLVSYAIHWIKAEMQEFILRNWRLVKMATSKAQRKLFFNLRSLKTGFNSLTRSEIQAISKALRVSPKDVLEMECRFGGGEIALEASNVDDDTYAPASYLADPDAGPLEIIEAEQSKALCKQKLASALAALDARSRRIVEARWLQKQSRKLRDLANEFQVSVERIRQIEATALRKMEGVINTLECPALADSKGLHAGT